MAKQRILDYMPSPFQRGQGVATLACGHLFSINVALPIEDPFHPSDLPAEVECRSCELPEWIPFWEWTESNHGFQHVAFPEGAD